VDHLPLVWAFALSSAVSIVLVISYLCLVVSPSFAYREAAVAQGLYLIGFSLAHFWEGYTGLTVTVLSITTQHGVMQLTGRIKWSQVLTGAPITLRPGPESKPA
jgi:inner membrane protein involved in colicin E2 resistance